MGRSSNDPLILPRVVRGGGSLEAIMPDAATVCYTYRLVDEHGERYLGVKQGPSLVDILDQLRRSHIDYRQVYLEYQFSCDDSGTRID